MEISDCSCMTYLVSNYERSLFSCKLNFEAWSNLNSMVYWTALNKKLYLCVLISSVHGRKDIIH